MTVEELEREMEAWFFGMYPGERTPFMQPFLKQALLEMQRKKVEEYRPMLDYLPRRKSPPRCMACGGTAFVRYPESDGVWYDHPQSLSKFQVVPFLASMSFETTLHDVEGLRLTR